MQTLSREQRANIADLFTRIDSDINGNPRYVIHYLQIAPNYQWAVYLANKIGGKKYHTKRYGGGIVFQSYSIEHTYMDIQRIKPTETDIVLWNMGTSFKSKFYKHDLYFQGDKQSRDIYKCTLRNASHSYTFTFGQSIADAGKCPTSYDVISCLQKYEVGTFEDFCSEFGYDSDSRSAYKTYKAVCKEWNNICKLFTSEQLEVLRDIQ